MLQRAPFSNLRAAISAIFLFFRLHGISCGVLNVRRSRKTLASLCCKCHTLSGSPRTLSRWPTANSGYFLPLSAGQGASFGIFLSLRLLPIVNSYLRTASYSTTMSDTRRADLRDRTYGTVHELCSKLGYAGDRKGNPRSTSYLSSKTTKYRKDCVKDIGRGPFPLEYDDEYAQLCASMFLSENPHLFPDSRQAEIFNWPVCPRDQAM